MLASVVSTERRVRDARMVFQKAKQNCGGRKPKYIVTDGLHSYKGTINKEFVTSHQETEHLWNVGLQHHPNNNHVERLHGSEKERFKVMRGFDQDNGCATLSEGFRVHYNLIRDHQTLGVTPGEVAGLPKIEGFRWLEVLKKATSKC